MFDLLYDRSLLVAWVILFTLSFLLVFGKVPRTEAFYNYNRTRKILGAALFFWGVQVLLQWVFQFRTEAIHIATALNLTCYYMGAILFGMGYISLLDPTYINPRQMRTDFIQWTITCSLVWIASLLLHGTAQSLLLILCAFSFFLTALRIAICFFRTYRKAVREMNNYYSDSTERFIRWLYRSTYGIVFFGLIGAVMAFATKGAVGIYMSAGIVMFIYIYNSLQNYLLNYEMVNTAVQAAVPIQEPPLSSDSLKESLEGWIANHGYRQSGITIDQLADAFGSNRSYISDYFNKVCNISFREWINDLRMTDAKQLLLENQEMTIEQVSEMVGFSSKSYFSTLFKQREKLTPSQWRTQQVRESNAVA